MAKTNVWLSVSDLMTGLMVIFLFVAIAYISRVQKNQSVLTDYVETKKELHDKLIKEFEGDTLKWQMTIGKDLTMKFKKPTAFFATGSSELTPRFKEILDEFLPRYFNILLNDSLRSNIQEIRIEGHTDDVPMPSRHPDPYIANAMLSQDRALAVVKYFRSMPQFETYSEKQKQLLEYWFIANGLSYGKALDVDGDFIIRSGKPIDRAHSRRVEFREVEGMELCGYCKRMLMNEEAMRVNNSTDFVKILKEAGDVKEPTEYDVDIFGYVKNWEEISLAYRTKRNFTCERCGTHVEDGFDHFYMQTHHKNGVKTDNQESNLECLCIKCHSEVNDTHRRNFSSAASKVTINEYMQKYHPKENYPDYISV